MNENMTKQKEVIDKKIAGLQRTLEQMKKEECNLIDKMDIVEQVVSTCGGEPKTVYLDVSRDFMKIYTRISLDAYLYPFISEAEPDNTKLHKVIIQQLLRLPWVDGVKWIPVDKGSHIIIVISQDN